MEFKLVYSDVYLRHEPWYRHPENPLRLKILFNGLEKYGLKEYYDIIEPEPGDWSLAYKVHVEGYINYVRRLGEHAPTEIDPDTYVSKGTLDSILYSIGGLVKAYKEYRNGRGNRFFVLTRPPGHHAGRAGKAMGAPTQGFCIVNNIAVLAAYLLEEGYERIAIIDFDVHHGNGTQEIFYREPRVLHIDFHQDPRTIYPGTGFPEDIGSGRAEGTKINFIFPRHGGDDLYEEFLEIAVTILKQFDPQVILYSAGFDAYSMDGLADMKAGSKTFYLMAKRIIDELKPGLVIAALEGGYSVGLERGVPAFIAGLIGVDDPVGEAYKSSIRVRDYFYKNIYYPTRRLLNEYWDIY